MKAKMEEKKQEQLKEKSKPSNLMSTETAPRPGQFKKFSLLTKKDNVKLRRKRRKQATQKLQRLKFQLIQQLKAFKQEQMEIFAGVPE